MKNNIKSLARLVGLVAVMFVITFIFLVLIFNVDAITNLLTNPHCLRFISLVVGIIIGCIVGYVKRSVEATKDMDNLNYQYIKKLQGYKKSFREYSSESSNNIEGLKAQLEQSHKRNRDMRFTIVQLKEELLTTKEELSKMKNLLSETESLYDTALQHLPDDVDVLDVFFSDTETESIDDDDTTNVETAVIEEPEDQESDNF